MNNLIEKDNYFAYELDELIDLHNEIINDYKLLSIFNKSKSCNFISLILDNLIFNNIIVDDTDSDEDDYL